MTERYAKVSHDEAYDALQKLPLVAFSGQWKTQQLNGSESPTASRPVPPKESSRSRRNTSSVRSSVPKRARVAGGGDLSRTPPNSGSNRTSVEFFLLGLTTCEPASCMLLEKIALAGRCIYLGPANGPRGQLAVLPSAAYLDAGTVSQNPELRINELRKDSITSSVSSAKCLAACQPRDGNGGSQFRYWRALITIPLAPNAVDPWT